MLIIYSIQCTFKAEDEMKDTEDYRARKIREAMEFFKEIRKRMGAWPATETVIKLRDEEYERWNRSEQRS